MGRLGPGVAARVWATLEAWSRWKERSGGCETGTIELAEPALQSLGVGHLDRPHDARRAL